MRISINTANTQSQVISILRFPLVVLILFIHSNFHNISADWDVFWTINTTGIGPQVPSLGDVFDIISNSLATLANPFFFFISGSLFFKEGLFSKELYLHKLQRRAFSLLLPYILWISTYLFLLSVAEGILPNWTAIVHKPIESFSFTDWLLCFWDISKIGPQGGIAAPLVIPFWYIRDLMIICLFTPIIYKVLHWLANKRKEISILLFFALLYASRWAENLPGLSVQGLLFFSFGAFFSIKQIKFIDVMRPLKWGGLFFAIFAWQINCANLMYAGLIVFTVSTTTRILERRKQQKQTCFSAATCSNQFHFLCVCLSLYCVGWHSHHIEAWNSGTTQRARSIPYIYTKSGYNAHRERGCILAILQNCASNCFYILWWEINTLTKVNYG